MTKQLFGTENMVKLDFVPRKSHFFVKENRFFFFQNFFGVFSKLSKSFLGMILQIRLKSSRNENSACDDHFFISSGLSSYQQIKPEQAIFSTMVTCLRALSAKNIKGIENESNASIR